VLILVRHGRTEANASGLLLGRADVDLDSVGAEQGERLAEAVGPVARVVTSPLRRAVAIAEMLDGPVTVDERWVELDYGELDRRAARDVPADVWRAWRADPAFEPPGGESLATLATRVGEACEELAEEARSDDVAVVSHVSPIKAAVAWALGVGIEISWRTHLDPASITRVVVGDRGPLLLSFNETRHLR
jgi:broad specificity phosphatase PhoE